MTGMLILNSTEVLAAEAELVHELAPAPKVMDMDELLALVRTTTVGQLMERDDFA